MIENDVTSSWGEQPTESRVMPDLRGIHIDRARRILEVFGLPGVRILLSPMKERRDHVIEQEPLPGDPMPNTATEITLWVEADNPNRLLPEIYREADEGRIDYQGNPRPSTLMARFLSLVQNLYGTFEWWVDHNDRIYSPEYTPDGFLPFLEQIFPYEVDSSWSVRRRREILTVMPELLRRRGTAYGLELMILVYTGVQVKVHERSWPHKGMILGDSPLGEGPMVSKVPTDEEGFFVELPSDDLPRDVIERIHRVVDNEKPANLAYCLWSPVSDRPLEVNEAQLGIDFIIGKTPVSGVVRTPGARLGVPEAVAPEWAPGEDWRYYTRPGDPRKR